MDIHRKSARISFILNKYLRVFFGISVGVFLFVLFFQPFSLDRLSFDNRLLYTAGLAMLVFLGMVSVRLIFQSPYISFLTGKRSDTLVHYFYDFVLFAITSTGMAFYVRYVGDQFITFPVMLKIVCICIAPPVILSASDIISKLRLKNRQLLNEMKQLQKRAIVSDEKLQNPILELVSDNGADHLSVQAGSIVFARSADNYAEIFYLEGESLRKKLIRSTLLRIENQLKESGLFVRTHRTCIVNTRYIEKLVRNNQNFALSITGVSETLPVARQYLMVLKDLLNP